ncbi:peptide chain release factor 2 [Helicobacter turcicus]|uniref:Peptide chain release factor 2 n=1 Tax=Helicobacter turcicus TaxID=2867412 RepID=A0ABS7JL46_9HELI|nr:peptide chain release factor 2 [Helicobacter turcicus]MBX7490101.1 peptide chain release factor 2 [Helicobacter turcicus]MBX7544960.1 peptide chain release factor 2 [Helicobacter turcicus]
MDTYTYSELLKTLDTKCKNITKIMQPNFLKKRIDEISTLEQTKEFWDNAKQAGELQKEKKRCERQLEKYNNAKLALDDARELFELSSDDSESLEALFAESEELEQIIKHAEIEVMLSDSLDSNNAIFTITPGAGGTESQDWASMLYRMYLRWAERKGFKVELLDYQEGDEAGIKDVSFIVKGENAYGYAKAENGVHRLVRISPFDANAKRHTSFSSVQVSPEIDDEIDIVIEEKDLRIDTYRASGAGGQHVNKTESAIRITHQPTGIVVQCQNDRSQHKNKASALKMLKSKLYELERLKREEQSSNTDKGDNGWGHQIRSYVLTPYQQVKDLRSNLAYTNVDAILDGDIDAILEGVLIYLNTQNTES